MFTDEVAPTVPRCNGEALIGLVKHNRYIVHLAAIRMLDQVTSILNGGGKGMARVGCRWHNHRAIDAVNGHTDGICHLW